MGALWPHFSNVVRKVSGSMKKNNESDSQRSDRQKPENDISNAMLKLI